MKTSTVRTKLPNKASARDRLVSRPNKPLPTPLDPASPEARNSRINPKPVPEAGQGDRDASDPAPEDTGRSA